MQELVKTKYGLFDIAQIPADSEINKRVKPILKGEFARYRVYNSYDPVTKKYRLNDLYLPNRDVVQDPNTGTTYDIGYVTSQTEGGNPTFGDIWFTASSFCMILLHGSKIKDKKLYDYLERCNYNVSNPLRDPSAPALIERVEEGSDAKILRTIRKRKQQAFALLDEMSDTDVTSFLKAKSLSVPATEDQRRESAEVYIDKFGPDELLNSGTGDVTSAISMIETVEQLRKKEVIAYDKALRIWSSKEGQMLLNVKKGAGIDPVGELANYFLSGKGAKILNELESE